MSLDGRTIGQRLSSEIQYNEETYLKLYSLGKVVRLLEVNEDHLTVWIDYEDEFPVETFVSTAEIGIFEILPSKPLEIESPDEHNIETIVLDPAYELKENEDVPVSDDS